MMHLIWISNWENEAASSVFSLHYNERRITQRFEAASLTAQADWPLGQNFSKGKTAPIQLDSLTLWSTLFFWIRGGEHQSFMKVATKNNRLPFIYERKSWWAFICFVWRRFDWLNLPISDRWWRQRKEEDVLEERSFRLSFLFAATPEFKFSAVFQLKCQNIMKHAHQYQVSNQKSGRNRWPKVSADWTAAAKESSAWILMINWSLSFDSHSAAPWSMRNALLICKF